MKERTELRSEIGTGLGLCDARLAPAHCYCSVSDDHSSPYKANVAFPSHRSSRRFRRNWNCKRARERVLVTFACVVDLPTHSTRTVLGFWGTITDDELGSANTVYQRLVHMHIP